MNRRESRSGLFNNTRRCCLIAAVVVRLAGSQTAGDPAAPVITAIRAGKLAEAQQLVEAALAQRSQDPRLWALDGLVEGRLGHPQKALTSYKHALEIAPDYLPALEGAAEIAYKSADPEAEIYLRAILKTHPEDQTAHGMLAALSFEHGRCQNAVNEFANARDAIASNLPALKQYGYCLLQLKRPVDAIPVFEHIRQLKPSDPKASYRLAVVQSIAGQPQSVVETLQPEIEKNPSDAAALALLADAYESLSDTPRAVAALRQAIVLRPDVPDYYLDFANICLVHDSFQVGVDMLNTGLARTPKSAPLYMARGILFIQQGKYPDAQADFAKAEHLDPQVRFGSPVQGLLELQQNNLAGAETTIRGRLKAHPNDAYLHYLLAEVLIRKGAAVGSPEFNEALQASQNAVALQPVFPLARDQLGRLYLQDGKTKQAIEQSRLAISQDPSDQMALYHLLIAFRKDNQTAEIPALSKKLAGLRAQARVKEENEHKYMLVETKPPGR